MLGMYQLGIYDQNELPAVSSLGLLNMVVVVVLTPAFTEFD